MPVPKSVDLLAEAVQGALNVDAAAATAGRTGLSSTLPGEANGELVAYSMHDWLLTNPSCGLILLTESPYLRMLIAMCVQLSRRGLAGEMLTSQQWKSIRKQAVEATNSLPEGDERQFLCRIIEDSVWSPVTSSTVLHTLFRSTAMVHAQRAGEGREAQSSAFRAYAGKCSEALLSLLHVAPNPPH